MPSVRFSANVTLDELMSQLLHAVEVFQGQQQSEIAEEVCLCEFILFAYNFLLVETRKRQNGFMNKEGTILGGERSTRDDEAGTGYGLPTVTNGRQGKGTTCFQLSCLLFEICYSIIYNS